MNVALVGCGRVSNKHFRAIEANGLTLFCVYDIIKKRMPKNTGHYVCFEDMIGDPHVDIVSICTPSGLHPEMVCETALFHKHILVEKPLALYLYDAETAIKLCRTQNVKLSVVAQNRFNPPMQILKQSINDGILGKILLADTI